MPLDRPPTPSPLAVRLLTPLETVSLAALPAHWFHQRVEIVVKGAGALADDITLPGRIRGAWGQELMRAASPEALADHPCPWDPPCTLDVLFREQAKLTPRLSVPRPYVIAAKCGGDDGADLAIRLTLFGFATDWTDSAAEALVAALRHGDPLRLGPEPLRLGRIVHTVEHCPLPADPGLVVIAFRTPVAFRSGGDAHKPTARSLVSGLGNRISGLARWQDSTIAADWRGLADLADGLFCDTNSLKPVVWHRRSNRQAGRLIPITGWKGHMRLQGDLAPILPLLVIGKTCHAGSHTTHGLGAYTLEWPP